MTNEQVPPTNDMPFDLKSVVEATFGPGAFDLIADSDETPSGALSDEGTERREDETANEECETSACSEATNVGQPQLLPATPHPKLVLFELAGHLFGISVSNVLEIRRAPRIRRIPNVPGWVRGVTNLRGSIVSVVDLRLRFGLAPLMGENRRRMIVVRSLLNEVTTGLLVDRIIGIRVLPDPSPHTPDPTKEPVTQFASEWRDMDEQPVALLDLEKAITIHQTN